MQSQFFTNDVFPIIYSYSSILETNETIYLSPPQISRNTRVRGEIDLLSQFSDSIRETLTDNEIQQIIKIDLRRILA